mgnify:FL=1
MEKEMEARCLCGRIADSAHPEEIGFSQLPFFVPPEERCECGYAKVAHTSEVRYPITDHEYKPFMPKLGSFYCGCRGWE